MKYIKRFENIENTPKIGDYVICQDIIARYEVKDFISNNIGQIIYIVIDTGSFSVQYENVPKEFKSFFYSTEYKMKYYSGLRKMMPEEIIKFSKNKEEIEDYLITKKYNL